MDREVTGALIFLTGGIFFLTYSFFIWKRPAVFFVWDPFQTAVVKGRSERFRRLYARSWAAAFASVGVVVSAAGAAMLYAT
jgi:hypothetical protein